MTLVSGCSTHQYNYINQCLKIIEKDIWKLYRRDDINRKPKNRLPEITEETPVMILET